MTITIDESIRLAADKLFYVAALKEKAGNTKESILLWQKAMTVYFYYNSNGGDNTDSEKEALEAQYLQWAKQVQKDYESTPLEGMPPMLPANYNATETVAGIAKISVQGMMEDTNADNDETMVSPKKHWQAFRFALEKAWTWTLQQTFATAPKLSSLTASKYLKLNGSKEIVSQDIPGSDIVEDSTHRFVTNAQIAAWNAKVSDYVWSEITDATVAMGVGQAYIMNRGTLVTGTLPASAALGDKIYVLGKGAGLWTIAQNANQYIQYGAVTTTVGVGGSLSSATATDLVELRCIEANNGFRVVGSVGVLVPV